MSKIVESVYNWLIKKLARPEEFVYGRDRAVLVYKHYVVKRPIMSSWIEFIRGLYSNLREMEAIKTYEGKFPDHLPEIISSWCFGLIIVQKRYSEVLNTPEHRQRFWSRVVILSDSEFKSEVYLWEEDVKPANFGWDKYGRLVKFDLGTAY